MVFARDCQYRAKARENMPPTRTEHRARWIVISAGYIPQTESRNLMGKPPVRDPEEVPPATPGVPAEPPEESPKGNPRPEIPPVIDDPAEPPTPQDLPGRTPDEVPVRGPNGPRTPYPASDPGITDLPGSEPDVIPGTPSIPGTI